MHIQPNDQPKVNDIIYFVVIEELRNLPSPKRKHAKREGYLTSSSTTTVWVRVCESFSIEADEVGVAQIRVGLR